MASSDPTAGIAVAAQALVVAELDVAAAFRAHYRFVWRVLLSAGVPLAAVDDAVQDVFVTVHRRRADYDGRAPLRHWVYGIARGVGRNHGRKALRKSRHEAAIAQGESALTAPPQDAAVQQRQARDLLARFVETLAPEQREVFTLVHIEGMAVPEIAVMLGAPVNTVYSRLRLARQRFEAMVAQVRQARTDP